MLACGLFISYPPPTLISLQANGAMGRRGTRTADAYPMTMTIVIKTTPNGRTYLR